MLTNRFNEIKRCMIVRNSINVMCNLIKYFIFIRNRIRIGIDLEFKEQS